MKKSHCSNRTHLIIIIVYVSILNREVIMTYLDRGLHPVPSPRPQETVDLGRWWTACYR